MSDTITTMRSALAACAAHSPAVADSAAAAYYELLRAHLRQEAAPDPVGCVAVVGDLLSDAARAEAVTPSEALSALHDIIDVAAPMVGDLGPDGARQAPTLPALDSQGHAPPHDCGFPLEVLYDQQGLAASDQVPRHAVLRYLADSRRGDDGPS